jgi:hypothetical protein
MAKYLDEQFWRKALTKPDWYLRLEEDFKRLEKIAKQKEGQPDEKEVKGEAYELVEEALRNDMLPLAKSGDNLDKERKPIDTIVIHHTKNKPGMRLERLNAMQLLLLYGKQYAHPIDARLDHKLGDPVWSNHFYNGKQIFWAYHWFIRENGEAEQIMGDEYIGWHAGKWEVNTRSVAICVDDNLKDKQPDYIVIQKIAKIIKQHYPHVEPGNIIGHCEVNPKTECPGRLFNQTWRTELLKLL